jgi:ABC-type transport system involved in multi-copper enzyme maturation permease subunit
MWTIEFKETAKQAVFIMAFFVIVPMLYLVDQEVYRTGFTFLEYMSSGFDLFILITAVYLGYNMFKAEDEDGATEYLLSLPIDRWKLFRYKVIPRIAVMTLLLVIGSQLNDLNRADGSVLGSIFVNWYAGILYLVGLIAFIETCGFVLGLVGRRSWSTLLVLSVMILCVWQFGTISIVLNRLILKVFGIRSAIQFTFWMGSKGRALLDFSVFFMLLWYILKSLCFIWDLKPLRVREIWFQKRMILPMVVFLLLFLNRFLVNQYIPFISYW